MSKLLDAKRRLLEDDIIVPSKKINRSTDDDYCDDKKSSKDGSKHKKKKEKKSKKKKKSHKKEKRYSSSESSTSDGSDSWVEKPHNPEPSFAEPRDDWMKMSGNFSTFTRKDLKPDKPKEKNQIDAYVPSQSSRELNPYWKNGGSGLPSVETKQDRKNMSISDTAQSYSRNRDSYSKDSKFKRPNDDNMSNMNDKSNKEYKREVRQSYESSKKNWQKKSESKRSRSQSPNAQIDKNVDSYDMPENHIVKSSNQSQDPEFITEDDETSSHYLTDQEMNALGAKIVKAEIMGNTQTIADLSAKLERARIYKKNHPEGPPGNKKDNAVMLTMTDDKGNTRPLAKSLHAGDSRSKGGKKAKETHSSGGERMRFFADDDKYSLKDMFQKEKYENANESEEQFADIISKHRNPNDDLEDIFAENIMKVKSDAKTDTHNLNKAISQHKSIQRSLDNCENCIESSKMIKHMIISLGSKAYISLPPRQSLTEGHCIISTNTHVQSSTFVDEDVWSEILMYRKALTNMFNSRDEDVVFFETAYYLHKHPHMVIDCVPLPRDVGDSAPIYFKKALLECEAEWSTNKKVVDLKNKDVRRGIPKGLPYFWVDFGMDPGFAHVIEDQELFPKNFAQEIIGGMLDLHHSLWRKPNMEKFDAQRKKVLEFTKMWKPFDCTPT